MTTALQSAVLRIWADEIDPDRELEVRIVREGLMQDDSRVLVALGTVGPETYLRLGQLGYMVADMGRSVCARDWLRAVADTMRSRIASARRAA